MVTVMTAELSAGTRLVSEVTSNRVWFCQFR